MSVTREALRAPTASAGHGTVLAFDFGTRKIGVAVGNTMVRVAHPLTTIRVEATAARMKIIAALLAEWRPAQLVVGRPLHEDGSEHEMTARAERFARSLEGRFGIPVAHVDERFTTRTAAEALGAAGVRGSARRAAQDEVAAQTILQAFFDDPHSTVRVPA
jgi:putative Holliday junction resolvase